MKLKSLKNSQDKQYKMVNSKLKKIRERKDKSCESLTERFCKFWFFMEGEEPRHEIWSWKKKEDIFPARSPEQSLILDDHKIGKPHLY